MKEIYEYLFSLFMITISKDYLIDLFDSNLNAWVIFSIPRLQLIC